jgi:hypothetical protein
MGSTSIGCSLGALYGVILFLITPIVDHVFRHVLYPERIGERECS